MQVKGAAHLLLLRGALFLLRAHPRYFSYSFTRSLRFFLFSVVGHRRLPRSLFRGLRWQAEREPQQSAQGPEKDAERDSFDDARGRPLGHARERGVVKQEATGPRWWW